MFKIPELLKASQGILTCGSVSGVIRGISIDSRSIKKGEAFIAIKGEKFDGHDFISAAIKKGAGCIITQEKPFKKGATFIRVKDTLEALGGIASFHRQRFNLPLIAVTGSNGKTTTKEMIATVLSEKFKVLKNPGTRNNHIGLPLTLLELDNSYEAAVVEIGTNHFGEVSYLGNIAQANIGVITNIGQAHLEYLNDLKGVFKEKYSLINCLKAPAVAILNADDNFLKKVVAKNIKSPFILGIGLENKCEFCASDVRGLAQGFSFRLNKRFKFALNTLGYYNIYNSLIAIAIGRIFGLGYREIAASLASFNLPKGRLNFRKIKGIKFIDDTYNANPLSMRQALGVLKNFPAGGRKILIMGDMLELGLASSSMHLQAIKEALGFCDTLITVGAKTKSCLSKLSLGASRVFSCDNPLEARSLLLKKAHVSPGDIVLVKGSRRMKMEEVFKT